MYAKVVQSSKENYWYADKIGCTFDIVGEEEDIYKVEWIVDISENGFMVKIAPILKKDAKLVTTKNFPNTRSSQDWRMKKYKIQTTEKFVERSGHKTLEEIKKYERLNAEAEVLNYRFDQNSKNKPLSEDHK